MEPNNLTSTFSLLRTRLRMIATSILGNDDDAQDALQDAFYKLWKRHHDIDSSQEAEGLAVTAVKNASIDMLRHRAAHPTEQIVERAGTADDDSDSALEREELYKRVTTIIELRLSERQRDVVKMRDMQGLSFQEIADRLDMSAENVRMTLSRSRKIIRDIYRNMNYE